MPRQRQSTMICNERKATTAHKRAAFDFQTPNEKPLACAKGYAFDATGNPTKATGSEPNTPATEVLSHEFYS